MREKHFNMVKFLIYFTAVDGNPGLSALYLNNNRLKTLQAGTIPLTRTSYLIHLDYNQLSTIQQDAFYPLSEPG